MLLSHFLFQPFCSWCQTVDDVALMTSFSTRRWNYKMPYHPENLLLDFVWCDCFSTSCECLSDGDIGVCCYWTWKDPDKGARHPKHDRKDKDGSNSLLIRVNCAGRTIRGFLVLCSIILNQSSQQTFFLDILERFHRFLVICIFCSQVYIEWKRRRNIKSIKYHTPIKQSQVYYATIILVWISNPNMLKYLACIQLIANFGWGVASTVQHTSLYFEATSLSLMHDTKFDSQTKGFIHIHIKLLSKSMVLYQNTKI